MVTRDVAEQVERLVEVHAARPTVVDGFVEAVTRAGYVLGRCRALDLETHELSLLAVSPWPEIQGSVEELVAVARSLADRLLDLFPRGPSDTADLADLDLAIALEDDEAPSPIRDRYELRLGRLYDCVEPGQPHTVGPAAAEVAAIILRSMQEHEARLRVPALTADPDVLLPELRELQIKLDHAVEALIAMLVRGLTDAPLGRIAPDIVPPAERAARLRGWAARLARALREAERPTNPVARLAALSWRVEQAAAQREAGWLRPHDRAGFQRYRRWARAASGPSLERVEAELASLEVWVQGLSRINARELLIAQDRRTILVVLGLLENGVSGRALNEALSLLHGRDRGLDAHIERALDGRRPSPADLTVHLQRIDRLLKTRSRPPRR